MPEVKLHQVVSFSSEDTVHQASNLLKASGHQKWLCASGGEKEASVLFQLEKPCEISSVDIGNAGSAFIEVLVGRSSAADFQVLVVASSFMTPADSKMWAHLNAVRLFSKDSLSQGATGQKWDRLKIVCRQPFNKLEKFGISFVKLHGPGEADNAASSASTAAASDDVRVPTLKTTSSLGKFGLRDSPTSANVSIGSLFADRHKVASPSTSSQASSMAAQARDASTTLAAKAASSSSSSSTPAASSSSSSSLRPDSETARAKRRSPSPAAGGPSPPTARKRPAGSPNAAPKGLPAAKRKRHAKDKASVAFDEVLGGVTFALSGFQNPLRGELRDKGLALGADYKPQWEKGCTTHLIAAFQSTPKYTQVKAHRGIIVKKEWLEQCHGVGRRLSTKQFVFHSADASDTSDDEDSDTRSTQPYRNAGTAAAAASTSARPSPPPTSSSSSLATSTSAAKTAGTAKRDGGDSEVKVQKPPVSNADFSDTDSGGDNRGQPERYGAADSGGDTEEEIEKVRRLHAERADQNAERVTREDRHSSSSSSGCDTEVDEDMQALAAGALMSDDKEEVLAGGAGSVSSALAAPLLPLFFDGVHFLLYGDFKPSIRKMLCRYLAAYGGVLEGYMADSVQYVVTDSAWDDNFDQALDDVANLVFVRPPWVMECHDQQKRVAPGTHRMRKPE